MPPIVRHLLWFVVVATTLAVAGVAGSWESRDEAAADEYRQLERARAERYRARVERGDGAADRSEADAPVRQARRERVERRSGEGAWDREARAWRERVWRLSEELGDDLADVIRDVIDDALGEGGGR
ncbi:MAG: hypothetical protein GY723_17110 [bacterium]|nr:hypothetical protein [bacterium]MCP5065110.1 hypothetical protein [bacterium]